MIQNHKNHFAISAESMLSIKKFGDAQWDVDSNRVVWFEKNVKGSGFMIWNPEDNKYNHISVENVSATVNYGGGDFTVSQSQIIYVAGNQLWRVGLDDGVRTLIMEYERLLCSPLIIQNGRKVICIAGGSESVGDQILLCDITGQHQPLLLASDYDFYMQPSVNKSGNILASVGWNYPNMSWDSSEIQILWFRNEGDSLQIIDRHVLKGDLRCASFQPIFSPNGRWIAYVCDVSGWAEIYLYDLYNNYTVQLTVTEAEHSRPAWIHGMRTLAWSSDSKSLYALRNKDAHVEIWKYGVEGESYKIDFDKGFTDITTIDCNGVDDMLLCSTSGTRHSNSIVIIDTKTTGTYGKYKRIASECSDLESFKNYTDPILVDWSSDGDIVHGLYYPAMFRNKEKSPAVILVHGGPTGQFIKSFEPKVQFFTSRGYVVLLVNYRGSTGYGRSYMNDLYGKWGVLDRNDLISAFYFLMKDESIDVNRVVAMGSSAGGSTVLLALINTSGLFAAGICSYPVTDMVDLVNDTHRFERHYTDKLIGPYPEFSELYLERSAMIHADEIEVPLLLFHGDEDNVVSVNHSKFISDSLEKRNIPYEFCIYNGEGHGFRNDVNIVNYYERIDRFLFKYL